MQVETPNGETPARNHEPGTGRFLPGNKARQTHGRRSFDKRGADALPVELRAELDAFVAGVTADQGGRGEVTEIRRALIVRLSELHVVCSLLAADLSKRGILTARGRTRSTLQSLLAAVGTFDRLAGRLGLDRRDRAAGSLTAFLSGQQGDTDADGDGGAG